LLHFGWRAATSAIIIFIVLGIHYSQNGICKKTTYSNNKPNGSNFWCLIINPSRYIPQKNGDAASIRLTKFSIYEQGTTTNDFKIKLKVQA
jgi:hypothetical protein